MLHISKFWLLLASHKMNSFSAEIGSRGYHVYRDTTWRNISLHQPVRVAKETNELSIEKDPYCCKITITRVDRIGPVTIGHIPRCQLSRFVFYFLHEGGSVSGTVASIAPNISPKPEGGLEILMHFTHGNMTILEKMNSFVVLQVERMKEKLNEKVLFEDENTEGLLDEENYQEEIVVESDEDEDRNKEAGEERETNSINTVNIIVLD